MFVFVSCSKKVEIEFVPSADVEKKSDEILENVLSMSLDEKIGQLFMVGFDGSDSLSERDLSLINDFKVGGLIFFGKNIKTSSQVIKLINEIKALNMERKNIPLFLSLDQEGGTVTRLPQEILKFDKAMNIGNKNDEQFAYDSAKLMGKVISSLGFNMNFAPVLDVYTNQNNKVIGSRAFSNDKNIVANLGIATMNGFKDSNLIAVGKHYPGHGDTDLDSHYDLPIVKHDYERIYDVELYPFKKAIDAGLDMVLVSHLLYEKIDPDNIATLSRTFLYEILRKDMGFRGVVITDDMIMKGLTNTESISEASVKALKAGVDILLIGSGYENISKSIDRIKSAVINGEIDEFEIDRKVYNILRVKRDYKINHEKVLDIDVLEINDQIENLLNKN